MKSIKYHCIVVCLIMIFSMIISGCDGTATTPTTTPEPTEEVEAPQFYLPLTETTKTLTISTYTRPTAYNDMPVFQEIASKTNVNIEWEVIEIAEYVNAMSIKLASALNLPDIICMMGDLSAEGEKGLILPLKDLINENAPNIRKLFEDRPDIRRLNTTLDGEIYQLGSVYEENAKAMPFVMILRQDWLDLLDLDLPETTDDWYNVLKAFKTEDPNGNDVDDVLPFWGNPINDFSEAFGLYLTYSGPFYADDSGKVYYQYSSDRMKKYLEWLNKLYVEGLIDPNYDVPDPNVFVKVVSNQVGSSRQFSDTANMVTNMLVASGFPDAKMVYTLPPKGPDGFSGNELDNIVTLGHFGSASITKDCEEPELAIRWLDYVYASEEARMYFNWGIQGETYTMVDGQPQYTDYVTKNPDGFSGVIVLQDLVGGWPFLPWYSDGRSGTALTNTVPGFENIGEIYEQYYVDAFPRMIPNKQTKSELLAIMNDIDTYTQTMISDFVKGNRPLSEFDEYVQTLKDMDIETAIDIYQENYDAFMNN